jgi:hypothetical protein
VAGLTPNDIVLRFSPDGKSLWTRQVNSTPVRVEQVDLNSGARRQLLPEFAARRAGVLSVSEVSLADDPRTYAYNEREAAGYLFELKKIR